MNPLPPKVNRGTLGELLAQVHLLANGVQAAPPLRDSGNDLIACCGKSILSLQVKTAKRHDFAKRRLPQLYHAAVFIVLKEIEGFCDISRPDIYLMSRDEIERATSLGKKALEPFRMSCERVKNFFPFRKSWVTSREFKNYPPPKGLRIYLKSRSTCAERQKEVRSEVES